MCAVAVAELFGVAACMAVAVAASDQPVEDHVQRTGVAVEIAADVAVLVMALIHNCDWLAAGVVGRKAAVERPAGAD